MIKRDKIIHRHSSKALTKEQVKAAVVVSGDAGLVQGELAVINGTDTEAIYTLDAAGTDIIAFPSKKYVDKAIDDVTGTTSGGTSLGDKVAGLETDVTALEGKVTNLETTRLSGITAGDAIIVDPTAPLNPTIDVKIDPIANNALVKTTDGLKVIVPDAKTYTGENAIEVETSGTTNVISLKIDGASNILSQSESGLLSSIAVVKIGTPGEGLASQYKLVGSDGTTALGATIDITKDQFLESAEFIASATQADVDIDATVVIGDPYLKFVFVTTATAKTITYVAVKGLVDVYTGDPLTVDITDNVIKVNTDVFTGTQTSLPTVGTVKGGLDKKIDQIVNPQGDATLTLAATSTTVDGLAKNVITASVNLGADTATESNRLVKSATGLFVSNVINGGTF